MHIADVSHYVKPGSPIDEEAFLRGTSVYFPDRAVPMLPLELSTEICSLKPNVDRLVLSVELEIDRRGDILAQRFGRGVIRSVERMTYTDVHALLEGDSALRERYARLIGRFELMRELALVLNQKRIRRGAIDFDMPEPLIEFDEFGEMAGVSRSPRNIAHRLIEEFMLSANEAVASHLEQADIASIFRIHEKPDPKRVLEFEEIATHFGYSLGIGAMPVKKFRTQPMRRRDGENGAEGNRDRRQQPCDFLAQLPEADRADRGQTGGAHPELLDAALAQAGAIQRRQGGHFALAATATRTSRRPSGAIRI